MLFHFKEKLKLGMKLFKSSFIACCVLRFGQIYRKSCSVLPEASLLLLLLLLLLLSLLLLLLLLLLLSLTIHFTLAIKNIYIYIANKLIKAN